MNKQTNEEKSMLLQEHAKQYLADRGVSETLDIYEDILQEVAIWIWQHQNSKTFAAYAASSNYKNIENIVDKMLADRCEYASYNVSQENIAIVYDNDTKIVYETIDSIMARKLTERELFVVKYHIMEKHTLDDTADEIDRTRERVRQIEAKALRKLKKSHLKYIDDPEYDIKEHDPNALYTVSCHEMSSRHMHWVSMYRDSDTNISDAFDIKKLMKLMDELHKQWDRIDTYNLRTLGIGNPNRIKGIVSYICPLKVMIMLMKEGVTYICDWQIVFDIYRNAMLGARMFYKEHEVQRYTYRE